MLLEALSAAKPSHWSWAHWSCVMGHDSLVMGKATLGLQDPRTSCIAAVQSCALSVHLRMICHHHLPERTLKLIPGNFALCAGMTCHRVACSWAKHSGSLSRQSQGFLVLTCNLMQTSLPGGFGLIHFASGVPNCFPSLRCSLCCAVLHPCYL